ncbi:clustered-asparagine-rich protein isoform X2 [Halyomorpha halys]|uniref:clustered-asparagine-rich protein isoform X2 n=1 Tax=Halyomorpha halys TaxID=286706 RepID=UPI0006D51FC0|nr:uncharacterized protein LOC106689258 isoform X2 [Halyomorpha halys]KAE8573706.1 nanos [Halyomorpha halys]
MYSRVPSLVGLDLWQAINGEQEESQINNVDLLQSSPELLVEGNYHVIKRSDYNKNFIRFLQNDHAMNTLNNNLIKEILSEDNSTKDSSSHHHEQNWFDWNFPNRDLIGEEPMREELKMLSENNSSFDWNFLNRDLIGEEPTREEFKILSENYSNILLNEKNQTETLMVNPFSKEHMRSPPDLLDKNKYVESGWKDLPSTKNNNRKNFRRDNCCRFCLKNGEVQVYYESHLLKDSAGNVVCPILSKYTCPCCGATGKKAHTIRHCPFNAQFSSMLGNNYKVKRRNAAGHITTFRL